RCAQAPMAAAYALTAYAHLLARQEAAGTPLEALAVERERQRKLALYVEQTWPTSQAADIARHVLGVLLMADTRYAEAVEVLERVGSGSPNATRSLYKLAAAALQAQKNEAAPPPGKPSYEDRAVAALARIPELSPSADRATVQDYFAAK